MADEGQSFTRPSGLPLQGSPTYLASLLGHLSGHEHGFPFDRQIFVGLLICLISQRKNLIVDVDVEDIALSDQESEGSEEDKNNARHQAERRAEETVQRVIRMTELIATNIFGSRTSSVGMSPDWSSTDLSRHILSPPDPPQNKRRSTSFHDHRYGPQHRNRRRSSTLHRLGHRHNRTAHSSDSEEYDNSPSETPVPRPKLPAPLRTASKMGTRRADSSSIDTMKTPVTATSTSSSSAQRGVAGPAPLGEDRRGATLLTASPKEEFGSRISGEDEGGLPPNAHPMVFSQGGKRGTSPSPDGLPAATNPSQLPQRSAIKDLDELRKTLPKVLIVQNVDEASYDAQASLYQLLHDRKVAIIPESSKSEKGGKRDIHSSREDIKAGEGEGTKPDRSRNEGNQPVEVPLSGRFCCVWVRRRGYGNQRVPSFLLDKFTFSCAASYAALDGSGVYEEPLPELELRELMTREHLMISNRLANKTHLHPPLRLLISDLVSAAMHHPQLFTNISSPATLDIKDIIRVSRILFRPFDWKPDLLDPKVHGRQYDQRRKLQEALEREDWFATYDDVRMVWGNLINHRTELRTEEQEVWAIILKGGCARLSGVTPEQREVVEGGWEERGIPYEETREQVEEILRYSLDVV